MDRISLPRKAVIFAVIVGLVFVVALTLAA